MLFRSIHFCLNYCVALVCTFLLMILIRFLPDLSPGYAALVILPLVVVATVEGKSCARLQRVRPRNCQVCLASVQMMVLALVIARIFFLIGNEFLPVHIAQLGLHKFDSIWLAIGAFAVSAFVALRVGFALGLATELKGQQFSSQ